jgi:hypothetical protein
MEFYDIAIFNKSHLLVRAEEVFGFGEYIESWITNTQYVKLYSYSNYYVEVRYDNKTKNIADVKGINVDKAIQKYVSYTEFENELRDIYKQI